MAEIANEDMMLNFANTLGPSDIVYPADVGIDLVKIVPIKATKLKVGGKFACLTVVTLTFAGPPTQCPHTSGAHNFVSGGGSIAAAATKVKSISQVVLIQDDAGVCAGTWIMKANPFTVVPCACNVKIADAGQDKAKGV